MKVYFALALLIIFSECALADENTTSTTSHRQATQTRRTTSIPQPVISPVPQPVIEEPKPIEFAASRVINSRIETLRGRDVGRVNDLAIDPDTGMITFAILDLNTSFLERTGSTEAVNEYVATPWQAMRLTPEGKWVVFERENLTTFTPGASRFFLRASDMAQALVQTPDGTNVGNVADIYIDSKTGRVTGIAIEQRSSLRVGSNYLRVPWEQIAFTGQPKLLILKQA